MINKDMPMNRELRAAHDQSQVRFSVNVSPLRDRQLLCRQRLRRQARRLQRQRRLFALPDVRVSLTHSGMKFQGEPFKHIQKGFATFYPFMWQMIIFLFRIPRNATICSLQKVRGSITFHQPPKKASLINQLLVKKSQRWQYLNRYYRRLYLYIYKCYDHRPYRSVVMIH